MGHSVFSFAHAFHAIKAKRFLKWLLFLHIFFVTNANAQTNIYRAGIVTVVKEQTSFLQGDLLRNTTFFTSTFGPCTTVTRTDIGSIQTRFINELNNRLQTWVNSTFDKQVPDFIGKRSQNEVMTDLRSEVKNQAENTRQIAIQLKNSCGKSPTDDVVQPRPPTDDVQQPRPPRIEAGPPQTITLPQNWVMLRATITDPDNQVAEISWTHSSAGQARILAATRPSTRVENLSEGNHSFLLMVTDKRQNRYYDTAYVTVKQRINRPPVADAGYPQTIRLPLNRTTLFGNRSYDPDREPLDYSWSQLNPSGRSSITNSANAVTGVTNLLPGQYSFVLQVKDSMGLTDYDTVIITVNQRGNNPPDARAGADKTTTLPTNTMDLLGSGDDPDGDPVTFKWTKISGPGNPRITPSNEGFTTIRDLEEGSYRFQLLVTDSLGARDSDIVAIKVNADISKRALIAPVAEAGEKQSGTKGDTLFLSGSGRDRDGTITGYKWKQVSGTGQATIVSPTQAQTAITGLIKGEYEFELTVTDNDNLEGKDTVLLQINAPGIDITKILITIAIIIAALGAGVGIYSQRDKILPLFWIWRKEKIIVFFLNKWDRKIVETLMPGADKAKGYAVGKCSRGKIKRMKKKGLAVEILNTKLLTVTTPGVTKTYKFSFAKNTPQRNSVQISSPQGNYRNLILPNLGSNEFADTKGQEFPAFYIITLDGPLLPSFKEEIKSAGIGILQRVPDDSYIIFIKEARQLDELHDKKRFGFIRLINPYAVSDTGFIARYDHYIKSGNASQPPNIVIDLVLHREEDRPLFRDFLGNNRITEVDYYKNVVRVSIAPDMTLAYKLASHKYVQAVYEYVPPKLCNNIARQLVKIDAGDATGVQFVRETGEGEIIAVADTGIDRTHPDLAKRIKDAISWGRKPTNDTSDPDGHGTHVTGTIAGDGTASKGEIKGIAPGATIFFQSLLDDDGNLCELDLQLPQLLQEAYNSGARIMNISWGSATESYYTFESTAMDGFIHEHPEMLVVVAAGNEGKGEEGYVGFGSIGTPATNKNGLTVGASRNKRYEGGWAARTYGEMFKERFPHPPTSNEKISGDAESLAAFSSRGLCLDWRIKPDIVAPGTDILSAKSADAPLRNFCGGHKYENYAFLSGTSMATPVVSGAAALVREYYKKAEQHASPGAALIKATLINGTRKLTGNSAMRLSDMVPNANQGYGALDMSFTIPNDQHRFSLFYLDTNKDSSLLLEDSGQQQGLAIQITQTTWIRACMVFIDNPKNSTQTDVDLIVTNAELEKVWAGNEGINAKNLHISAEQRKRDCTNNIEIVRIDNAPPGEFNVDIVVRTMTKEEKLSFALVVTTGDLSATVKRRVYDIQ